WQPPPVEHALAPCQLERLARRLPRARRLDDLASDDSRVARVLEQEFVQLAADYFLDDRLLLGRDELVLALRREFRLRGLDRQYAGEPFAHVVAGRLDLGLLRELFLLDIAVERARHRLAQAREMRAAVALRNIVGKALH